MLAWGGSGVVLLELILLAYGFHSVMCFLTVCRFEPSTAASMCFGTHCYPSYVMMIASSVMVCGDLWL